MLEGPHNTFPEMETPCLYLHDDALRASVDSTSTEHPHLPFSLTRQLLLQQSLEEAVMPANVPKTALKESNVQLMAAELCREARFRAHAEARAREMYHMNTVMQAHTMVRCGNVDDARK